MSNKLYRIIGTVFDIDISTISDESNPETIDSWDSMNMYVLIDEIETEFNIKFNMQFYIKFHINFHIGMIQFLLLILYPNI